MKKGLFCERVGAYVPDSSLIVALAAAVGMVCASVSSHAQSRAAETIDEAKIKVPDLVFVETDKIVSDYGKYFYFHRAGVDFATAYADIRECDAYARGPYQSSDLSSSSTAYADTPYPYTGTMVGAAGGAIGNMMVMSVEVARRTEIERSRLRRVNMRTCMGFKGYLRYGLTGGLWGKFNFDANAARSMPRSRQLEYFQKQAKIASGPQPQAKAIDP